MTIHYNFGNGYISWAKAKYGGYSYANAVEFSTQQAQRLGWDSYGDTQYPAHVLRYYPYGRAFTAGGNQAIVEVALTQVGNQGGQPYWSWYGFDSRVEWCACFVSWCADQCGYIESGLVPKFAGCVDGANWFKSNGKWQNRTYEPKTVRSRKQQYLWIRYPGILKIPDSVWKIGKMAAQLSSHRVHYEKSVVSLLFRKIWCV